MSVRYSTFGLTVEADRPIPGLRVGSSAGPVDVRIETAAPRPKIRRGERRPLFASAERGQNGRPLLRVWRLADDQLYQFIYDDDAEFLVDGDGSHVWAGWPEALTIDDVGPYITGPILAFVLRLRGVTSLHASAVVVQGKAVAFLGPPGAGKSTTAAAFARLGLPILSDDVVALRESNGRFWALSGYPWLRLWPASVGSLFGDEKALPRIAPEDPQWTKCFLDLSNRGFQFAAEPIPVGAVYILGERGPGDDLPTIEEPSTPVRLLDLVGNTHMNYLPDKDVRAREFDVLGRLVKSVPVRIVIPHSSGERLDRLCEVILADFEVMSRSGVSHGAPG